MQRKFDINQTNLTWKYCEVLWKCSFLLSFKIMLGFSRKRHIRAIYVHKDHFCKKKLYIRMQYIQCMQYIIVVGLSSPVDKTSLTVVFTTMWMLSAALLSLCKFTSSAPGDICCLYDHHCQCKYLFVKQLRRYQDENQEKKLKDDG